MGQEFFADGSHKQPIHLNLMVVSKEGGGKTYFASTFPKPYFLTFSVDQGRKHVAGRFPGYDSDNFAEFRDHVIKLEGLIRAGKWPYKTLVVDGTSFLTQYAENWAKTLKGCDTNKTLLYNHVKWAMQELASRLQTLPNIHLVWTIHYREKTTVDTGGTMRVVALVPQSAGYWGEELPKLVFGRIWLDWIQNPVTQPDGTVMFQQVVRAYLRPNGMMNATIKRDGSQEGTGYVLPAYVDNLTFGVLADLMTICGVPVHDAPGELRAGA